MTAFTESGIECLRQITADERAAGRAPRPDQTKQIARPVVRPAWKLPIRSQTLSV